MNPVENPIDWVTLLKLTNNKPDLAKELLIMFAAELPALRHTINEAYQNKNMTVLKDETHKLHGSCCYTGVTRLKNLSQQLEEEIKLNQQEAIRETLVQLNAEIDLVLKTIKEIPYDGE